MTSLNDFSIDGLTDFYINICTDRYSQDFHSASTQQCSQIVLFRKQNPFCCWCADLDGLVSVPCRLLSMTVRCKLCAQCY